MILWAWGLSLAGIATRRGQFLPGAKNRTRLPANAGILPWRNRLRMIFVSMLFGFSAFSIALINMILKRLDFAPMLSSDVLVNYLSGVKLYSQDKRAGGSPMDGPDEPPRAAIRRRMIRVMIDVAKSGYDRWYILAHSLGTVVAWNGLMEIQQALPNYLDQHCWDALDNSPLRNVSDGAFNVNAMLPNRPLWVGPRAIIKRDALFEKFRGILTYGSPLERFCALWSPMVPINKSEDPFREGTEWVNVYDPTDPVGTWISDYNPIPPEPPRPGYKTLKPYNFPCRASPLLLYSHLCYLKAPQPNAPDGEDFLVNQVARWLVTGESLVAQIAAVKGKNDKSFWMPCSKDKDETERLVRRRVIGRIVQDVIVAVLLTLLTVLSLNFAIYPAVIGILDWVRLSCLAAPVTKLIGDIASGHSLWVDFAIETGALVTTTGVVVGLASWWRHRQSTKEHEDLREHYRLRSNAAAK